MCGSMLLLFSGDTSLWSRIIVMTHCNHCATHLSFYCNVRTTLNITLKVTGSKISITGEPKLTNYCQRSHYIQDVAPNMQNIVLSWKIEHRCMDVEMNGSVHSIEPSLPSIWHELQADTSLTIPPTWSAAKTRICRMRTPQLWFQRRIFRLLLVFRACWTC